MKTFLLRNYQTLLAFVRERRRLLVEVGALTAIFVVIYDYLIAIQGFEAFYALSRRYESIQLDHLVMATIPTCVVLIVLVVLRVRDANRAHARVQAAFKRIENLYAEQAELRTAADNANQAKSQFLAGMSHELRTPLNAVIGYSEIIEEAAHDARNPEIAADAGRIIGAGRHLLSLINQVLDLSKIEAGKVELELSTFDPAALAISAIETVRPAAVQNRNTLKFKRIGDLEVAWNDAFKLKQCLLNLLSNAVKFTSDGDITLTLRRESANGEDMLCFDVRDSGVGMTAEQCNRLFQPFTQADSSISRKFGGTGLGLAISRQLAQLMGGDITVVSSPGSGSTFTLRVALHVRNPAAIARSGSAVVTQHDHAILLVEDDEDAADLIQRELANVGLSVVRRFDGSGGLAACRGHEFSLIILDINLPDQSGWRVLRQLSAMPHNPPVIVVSIEDNAAHSRECGAALHLTKPVQHGQLAAAALRMMRTAPAPASVEEAADDVKRTA